MKTPFRADYTYTIDGSVIAIVDLDQGSPAAASAGVGQQGYLRSLSNLRDTFGLSTTV